MTHAQPPFPTCGRTTRLPGPLGREALRLAGPHATLDEAEVERELWCHLQAHDSDHHFALVMDLASMTTGAIWARWADDASPALYILPDCPHVDPESREPCSEFANHPGAHTRDLTAPPAETP
ncbi:hypothetical protein [Streptomyces sp. NBC_01477]|uniref:hypothetical protein n=1 Tax=Streptomyces sp. NBC_01477 TaxID=2976015 RepID=UPI002E36EEFB|nr:hypothetical protein [Streptomyces sp. NBC_01477]